MKIDKITKKYFFWLKIVSESNCSHGHILLKITILELFSQRDIFLYTIVCRYVYLLHFCRFLAKFTNVCPLILLIFHWELQSSVILTLCLSKKALFCNCVLFKPKFPSISGFFFVVVFETNLLIEAGIVRGGHSCTHFQENGINITLDYRSKKCGKCSIL